MQLKNSLKSLTNKIVDKLVENLWKYARPYVYLRVKAERKKLERIISEDNRVLAQAIVDLNDKLTEEQEMQEEIIKQSIMAWWMGREQDFLKQVELFINAHNDEQN